MAIAVCIQGSVMLVSNRIFLKRAESHFVIFLQKTRSFLASACFYEGFVELVVF